MSQPTLFTTPEDQLVVFYEDERELRDNFVRFHRQNPHVYSHLVRLARRWQRRQPGTKCGIGMLFEVCRWQLGLRGEGEPLALNNNYRAFYARLIMSRERDLAGLFNLRRQRK